MAKQDDEKMRGLLFSPEVLGGFGLLSAGLAGKNPSQAFPSMFQGLQTAQLYSKYLQDEKSRTALAEYTKDLPEDQKNLASAFPSQFAKTVFDSKGANLINLMNKKNPDQIITLDKFKDANKIREYAKQGFIEIGKPGSNTGLESFTKAGGELEKKIIGGKELEVNLTRMDTLFEPEFLTYMGKAKGDVFKQLDKLGMSSDAQQAFIRRLSRWEQANEQFFNQYRKLITGVAAGEKEIGWLQTSIPSSKDSPATYKAKIKLQLQINKSILQNAQAFKARGGKAYNADGSMSDTFKDYLKKNGFNPSKESLVSLVQVYKNDGYNNQQIEKIFNIDFQGTDWKKILENK